MSVYGQTLALPLGSDDAAFTTGLAALNGLSLDQASECLTTTKAVCQAPGADYAAAVTATIALVSDAPWPALP